MSIPRPHLYVSLRSDRGIVDGDSRLRKCAPFPNDSTELDFRKRSRDWTYENATDAGWPIRGELAVNPDDKKDAALISSAAFWQAKEAPTLYIEAAFAGDVKNVAVTFQQLSAPSEQPSSTGNGPKAPAAPWTQPLEIAVANDYGDPFPPIAP